MMRVSCAFGLFALVSLASRAQTPVTAEPASPQGSGCPPQAVCTPYMGRENLGGSYQAPDAHSTAEISSLATMDRCKVPLAQPREAQTSFPACRAPRSEPEKPSLEVAALKLPGFRGEAEGASESESLPDAASSTRLALLQKDQHFRRGDRMPVAVYPIRFPYTAREKFGLFVRDIYDPFNFAAEGFNALWDQSQGEPPEYGGGIGGYGKRFGAIVATDIVGEFTGTFLFPSIFHTDPRYFRMARGSLKRRFFYAISRQLITKSDSGDDTFNSAKLLSGIATTTISNSYYPNRDRSFPGIVEHTLINMGFDSLNDAFREFWPDVAHGLHIPAFVIRRTADPTFVDPMDPNPMPMIQLDPSAPAPADKNPQPAKPGLPKNLQ